jgi:hypothetical protein
MKKLTLLARAVLPKVTVQRYDTRHGMALPMSAEYFGATGATETPPFTAMGGAVSYRIRTTAVPDRAGADGPMILSRVVRAHSGLQASLASKSA